MILPYRGMRGLTTKSTDDRFATSEDTRAFLTSFNQLVFGNEAKKQYLIPEAYEALMQSIETGEPVDRRTADFIANGLKNWALENDCTHYTHWFQPLTGKTAEKHDVFFKLEQNGNAIFHFDGSSLIQQEPDASSFPSGGLRATHEARGYTVWDPSSPIFIKETKNGRTLCIPAIFISYTGESLDLKTPLLKSVHALEKAAVSVCHLFNENVKKVIPTLGWEQEYFLIDEDFYNARPDLVMTGRTLFGNASARGQQLEDHYFATIPERINEFMLDFELEALKVGIPLKTRHNEVAPNQYECAPIFEHVNIAADHNSLLMDLMEKIARRHKLRVLMHEKPFAGLNGSGKHNNWSMSTDTGENLLDPTDDPRNNLQFLTFFVNVVKAIDDNADLLRASIATVGNEHRLGANEAPPAIISVFTGENIQIVLDEFKQGIIEKSAASEQKKWKYLEVSKVPAVKLDNTDRNRTSPFPFTGNKFEFRAVGASVNVSNPMTVLNAIVADQLNSFKSQVDELINNGTEKKDAIEEVLRNTLISCEKRIFNGNNYSNEWVEEAERRGLSNIKSLSESVKVFTRKESIELFERTNIFTEREVISRAHVMLEEYIKKIDIEAITLAEVANTIILPAVLAYQKELVDNYKSLQEVGIKKEAESFRNRLEQIADRIEEILDGLERMEEVKNEIHSRENEFEIALGLHEELKPIFEEIRSFSDKLEMIVDDKHWPLPKYREMLFLH